MKLAHSGISEGLTALAITLAITAALVFVTIGSYNRWWTWINWAEGFVALFLWCSGVGWLFNRAIADGLHEDVPEQSRTLSGR